MIKMSTIKREGHTCQEYGTCRLPSSPPWSCSCQPIYCYFSQQGVWNGGKGQEKDLDLFLTSLQMIREQMKPVMERRLEVLSQGCRSSSSSWAPVTTKTRTGTTSPQFNPLTLTFPFLPHTPKNDWKIFLSPFHFGSSGG